MLSFHLWNDLTLKSHQVDLVSTDFEHISKKITLYTWSKCFEQNYSNLISWKKYLKLWILLLICQVFCCSNVCSAWLEKNRVKTEISREILQIPVTGTKILDRNDKAFFPPSKKFENIHQKQKMLKVWRKKKYFHKETNTFFENAHFLLLYSSLNMHLSSLCIFLKINQNLVQIFFVKLG